MFSTTREEMAKNRPGLNNDLEPEELYHAARAAPEAGNALGLSGGGYRAMIFHLGALWRLNEVGMLPSLRRISSVSGGSITAGVLGMNWKQLDFDNQGRARNFQRLVVGPVRQLAHKTVDVWSILEGLLDPWERISAKVAAYYQTYLFHGKTLQDLPTDAEGPRFVINATNVQTGAVWRFSRPYMGDYKVGLVRNPTVPLAVAVGASSAFPPFLSPVHLHVQQPYELDPEAFLQRYPFTSPVVLIDGGAYDNLGLETIFKRYLTLLVSDGGQKLTPEERPRPDWLLQSYRVLNLLDNQVRSLRKRELMDAYKAKTRDGAFWGIRTDLADFTASDMLPCNPQRCAELAEIPTRLKAIDNGVQERLINWGYAVCDAAIRSYYRQDLPAPPGFPHPLGV